MKLTPLKFQGFLETLGFSSHSLLVFGPDQSLLAFKVNQVLSSLSQKTDYKLIRLAEPPNSLIPYTSQSQPGLFADESEKTLLVIANVKDKFLKVLEAIETGLNDSIFLILEGLGLPTTSKLVKYHETQPHFFCVGVYDQSPTERKGYIKDLLEARSLKISVEGLNTLTNCLPSDPNMIEMEINKLDLYCGDTKTTDIESLLKLVTSEVSVEIDNLVHHVCLGHLPGVLNAYKIFKEEAQEDILLLRVLTTHFLRLFQVSSKVQLGNSLAQALETLKPRLFFKTKEKFITHLRYWTPETLAKALTTLKELEIVLKSSPSNPKTHSSRYLLRVSSLALKNV